MCACMGSMHVPVAWAALVAIHAQLPIGANGRPRHQRNPCSHACIVDEVACGWVVAAIDDDVVRSAERGGVGCGQPLAVCLNLHV